MLSPTIAAAAASGMTNSILSLPPDASTAAAIRAVSPGIGTPEDSAITRMKSSG